MQGGASRGLAEGRRSAQADGGRKLLLRLPARPVHGRPPLARPAWCRERSSDPWPLRAGGEQGPHRLRGGACGRPCLGSAPQISCAARGHAGGASVRSQPRPTEWLRCYADARRISGKAPRRPLALLQRNKLRGSDPAAASAIALRTRQAENGVFFSAAERRRADCQPRPLAPPPPPPPHPRTKWTRRVPHPVLIGHAARTPSRTACRQPEALSLPSTGGPALRRDRVACEARSPAAPRFRRRSLLRLVPGEPEPRGGPDWPRGAAGTSTTTLRSCGSTHSARRARSTAGGSSTSTGARQPPTTPALLVLTQPCGRHTSTFPTRFQATEPISSIPIGLGFQAWLSPVGSRRGPLVACTTFEAPWSRARLSRPLGRVHDFGGPLVAGTTLEAPWSRARL